MPTQVEGADGLQYVPPESSGLQSVQAPLEVAHARSYPNNTKPKNGGWNTGYGPGYPLERKRSDEEKVPVNNHGNNEDSRNRTICGLQRRAAIIIIVLIVIIIVGAVGGGVGGALASKNNNRYE